MSDRPSLFAAAALSLLTLPGAGFGQGPRQAAPLPDGNGKALVEANCTRCHAPNVITGSAGYTREGWRALIGSMVKLPDAEAAAVAQYLATHFPEKPGRRPVLVSGPARIRIREWTAPTLGQRSRDPLQTADGSIWWAGQYGSLVGRLNPATGEMKEYRLDPTARPHGIAADPAGNIWYTGNGNGTVGRVDAKTGEIKVYKTSARDPHTPIFDRRGILWFTAQGANMIGRLNPATGELKEVSLPTRNARPYGIQLDSKGVPWFSMVGTNKLGSIDPATMEIREYTLPHAESRARRLALTRDDVVWYTDFSRGYLGRFDPKTGRVKEWASPSGPGSAPYGIAVVNDVVWYNESGRRPDALVRFDPKTEKFQSWAIPSGVGIVRHMTPTREGNLLIHQSSTNRIGLVEIAAASDDS